MVEEARLESVYTPKGYPGFESPSLRRLGNYFLFLSTTFPYLQICRNSYLSDSFIPFDLIY